MEEEKRGLDLRAIRLSRAHCSWTRFGPRHYRKLTASSVAIDVAPTTVPLIAYST